jgi:hypothetical protein
MEMVRIAIGTVKGAFFAEGSGDRWEFGEQALPGWEVTAFGSDSDGSALLATGSSWYGAAIHRRGSDGAWNQLPEGPAYPEGLGRKLNQIWTMERFGDELWAGVDEAGLFKSSDNGEKWEPVEGLNDHPTREHWQPGFGGLCAHRLLSDEDHRRMWVGISAVGVFRSDDGGDTWTPVNQGVSQAAPDERSPDIGYCVHGLAADPSQPDTIWRQDHMGVYRTTDGGDNWEKIEDGLPAGFGFPMVRDGESGRLFVMPLVGAENRTPPGGRLTAYVSTDAGDTWRPFGNGLPDHPVYAGVLRGAMAGNGEGTVAFGTTAGTVHVSEDAGDHWFNLDLTLPRILAVAVEAA